MRKLLTSALLAAAAVSVSAQIAAADAFLLDMQAALDQRVAANGGYGGGVMRVQLGESGVVLQDESGVVLQDGSGILWQGASGWAENIGPSPITTLDTFEIASITKTFTATVILQMHEDNASPVRLSTPIGTLLPASVVENLLVVGGVDYGPEIQVGELLQQVSGLPDYWSSPEFIQAFDADPNRVWYLDELVAYAKAMTPIGIPSTTWHYADTNYVLLGMIVEAVTGQPLEEVFRQRILGPLGMSETYLAYHEPAASPRQESHRFEFTEDLHAQPRQSADWAGGGLVSSNADLQKFMRGLFQGRLFERSQTLDLMKSWTDTGAAGVTYGLGLFRVNLGAGRGQLWGHDGWGNSFMYFWPEQDIGFTGTLNQVDNDWYPLVEEAIAQWLLVSGPGNDLKVPGAVDGTLPLNARLSDGVASTSVSPPMALSLDVTDRQPARRRPVTPDDGQESSAGGHPRGDVRLADNPSDGPGGGQASDFEAYPRAESQRPAVRPGYGNEGIGSVELVAALRRLRPTTGSSRFRRIDGDRSLLCEAERYSLLHLLSAIELPSFAADYRSIPDCGEFVDESATEAAFRLCCAGTL